MSEDKETSIDSETTTESKGDEQTSTTEDQPTATSVPETQEEAVLETKLEVSEEESSLPKTDTEERISKVDKIFDELVEVAAESPEAKKEAVNALVGQMRQVAEQMRLVRSAKDLQELKEVMLSNWENLKDLTQDQPELLDKIQSWGDGFVEQKILYHDFIDAVKDDLSESSVKVGNARTGVQTSIALAIAEIPENDRVIVQKTIDRELVSSTFTEAELEEDPARAVRQKTDALAPFIESLNKASTGYAEGDINVRQAEIFMSNIDGILSILAAKGANRESVESLGENIQELRKAVSEASKVYKVSQTIRETHFLNLFNTSQSEQGDTSK